MAADFARVSSLHCYPLKSARGIELEEARLTSAGIDQDRRWMAVTPAGRFLTQRELPALALVRPSLSSAGLLLTATGHPPLAVPATDTAHTDATARAVRIWRDDCLGIDAGDAPAAWLRAVVGRECRLVRFAPAQRRLSEQRWTGGIEAENLFSDGFPVLILSLASLAELNSRLRSPLPMNRFRPNVVLDGLEAFDEDRIDELYDGELRLKLVKPCTRCSIPSTNQDTAVVEGDEPLTTLRTYRYDASLRGITFGQNAVVAAGAGRMLRRGQRLRVRWK
jgi:uncharacterized protein YcbX